MAVTWFGMASGTFGLFYFIKASFVSPQNVATLTNAECYEGKSYAMGH